MELQTRIEQHSARIAVIGQGYVGLPLALAFAQVGFPVTGIEVDRERVEALNHAVSHIGDVQSATLQALITAGRYHATTEMAELADNDAILICVPTPLRKSKDPDISFVLAAAAEVKTYLRPGQLVILESTTYPGTTEELLLPLFTEGGLRVGQDFSLAFSPERIDPGNPHFHVRDIPKIVGGVTPTCAALAALLYGQIVTQVLPVSSPTVAELAKLYENTFRSVNIALADEVNRSMPGHVVNLVVDGLNRRGKCLQGAQILVLGVAYKRGVADLRESPALDVMALLRHKGAQVRYADPFVPRLAPEGLGRNG